LARSSKNESTHVAAGQEADPATSETVGNVKYECQSTPKVHERKQLMIAAEKEGLKYSDYCSQRAAIAIYEAAQTGKMIELGDCPARKNQRCGRKLIARFAARRKP
jgi:hypothetical protein